MLGGDAEDRNEFETEGGEELEPEEQEPTGGRTARKREHDGSEEEGASKEPRLSAREAMQIRLLANVPALSGPLRDSRGRRRAVCLTSTELVDAGLSALVSQAVSTEPDDTTRSEGGEEQQRESNASSSSNPA